MIRRPIIRRLVVAALLALSAGPAMAGALAVPVLVPVSGFLSLEGTSQRNGAVLALRDAPASLGLASNVTDVGTSPAVAVTALQKALDQGGVVAVGASMLGTQMLAMMPVAQSAGVPLVTVSGTAEITERGNPDVFRFFPSDAAAKEAHARYVVQVLHRRHPAIIYQTTAYGQSGHIHLDESFHKLGVTPVFEDGVDISVNDMAPVLARALAAHPDVLVIHLHARPTALFIRAAAARGVDLPIVAGSAMHQPSTAALLQPAELKGVCAETASSPVSGGSPAMADFLARYRAAFHAEPDAYAVGQYDGMRMVVDAIEHGARTPAAVRAALAHEHYQGLAMTYWSDGKGNMAHSVEIVCYDGKSRVPHIVKRYDIPAP